MKKIFAAFVLGTAPALIGSPPAQAEWKPAKGPLMTRWTKDVSPENAHPEYPRPQMTRKEWLSLNGLWDYAVRPLAAPRPGDWDGEILVPFPIESALSGVMRRVDENEVLWYRRSVEIPEGWRSSRILLHFGAVDWEAQVFVNGKAAGRHRGGYTPFTLDITSALEEGRRQEIAVRVWDPTSTGHQPRGKQIKNPHGIWYTPTTGIWQSVWLEPVPAANSIQGLRITPDLDRSAVRVRLTPADASRASEALVEVLEGEEVIARGRGAAGTEVAISVPAAKPWSPDSPHLYDLRVSLLERGRTVDQVSSYFGLRKSSLGKDDKGVTRLFFNNQPLFQFGPLDQGFWPDGLYTAPTDEALRYDIEITRKLGFNMARKHVKVEPARWYYWCDKLGLLVWQDMPNGDAHVGPGRGEIQRSDESAENFERELKELIDAFYNHPSIVLWVPFNEGWGQYDTKRIADWVKSYDPSRLVICASGWNDVPDAGDAHDIHAYPGPGSPQPEERRAAVLGEFGGLGLPLRGHTWQDERNWGYRSYATSEELTEAYVALIQRLRPLQGSPGLSAAVYTQTTDVEIEVNGLMTYDRALLKMDAERITQVNRKVYLPPPRVELLVPTAEERPVEWRFTMEKPAGGWEQPGFDDAGWRSGPGGFGTRETPGTVVRTEWRGPEIWIRRSFELPAELEIDELGLRMHHDEDAEVYINGKLAARAAGFTSAYAIFPASTAAREALRPGKNTIAVHCRQTRGGQYIDVGLVKISEAK